MAGIAKDHQYSAGTTVKISVADTAISLGDSGNLAVIQPVSGDWAGYSATAVWIHCVDNPLYYCPGGTTPVTDGSVGHPMQLFDFLELKNFKNIKAAKFIRQGSATGAIMVTPFFNDTGKG